MIKTEQIQQFLSSKQGGWLALGVAGLFIIFILWQLMSGLVFLFSKPTISTTAKASFNQTHRKPAVNLSTLHIFGEYSPPQVDLKNLPESNLNVHLQGVFVAVPAYFSQAVISVPGGEQKVYFVGDELPGDATLYQVLANRVIIKHNGQLQNLLLPEKKLEFSPLSVHIDFPKAVRQPHRSLR